MITAWTSHLSDPEEKARFEREIRAAKPVLDRQKQIIEDLLKGIERSEMSTDSYDVPNWAYKQAHKNGNRAGLTTIKSLVDLEVQIQTKG